MHDLALAQRVRSWTYHRRRRLLRVQSGEGWTVAVMMIYSMSAVGGVLTVGFYNLADSIFLSRLPSNDTPFLFLIPGALLLLIYALYHRLASRLRLPVLAVGSTGVLALTAMVLRVLLLVGFGKSFLLLLGIYLYCEVAASLVIAQFWTYAGQLFHPRQARRLFGLIGVGGTIGAIGFGFFTAALVRSIGVDNLLLIVGGSVVVCGICAVVLTRQLPAVPPKAVTRPQNAPSRTGPSLVDDLVAIWRLPLLRTVAFITVLVSLLSNIGAFQFYLALQARYSGHGPSLASFLGVVAIGTGLAALTMQLSGTGFVMVRFGALAAQALFPLAITVAALLTIVTRGALWAVLLVFASDPILRRTIHDSSLNALYLPVPPELRARAKAVLEGVYAVTFGVLGAVFLAVQRLVTWWTYPLWSIPALAVTGIWIMMLRRSRQRYVAALVAGVNHRQFDFGGLRLDTPDHTTIDVLVAALGGDDERRIIHVLELIETAPAVRWSSHIVTLLSHSSAAVRVAALRLLGQISDPVNVSAIVPLLHSREDEVCAAAIDALSHSPPQDSTSHVAPLLARGGPLTRRAAIAMLLRHQDVWSARQAARQLVDLLASDDRDDRRAAASILGDLAGCTLNPEVREMLNTSVRHAPDSPRQRPVESTGNPVTLLINLLADSSTRVAAADALVAHKENAVAGLSPLLGDGNVDHALRLVIPTILQRIGDEAAVSALAGDLTEPDDAIRTAIMLALARTCSQQPSAPVERGALQAQLRVEIGLCYTLHVWRHDLDGVDADGLLVEALDERIERAIDRICALLELCYPGQGILRARRALTVGGAQERALVVEMLDTIVERHLSRLLLPLLEASSEHVLASATDEWKIVRLPATERIGQLARHSDPWLQACAVHCIGTLRDPHLAPGVAAALNSEIPLVREAAIAASRRLREATGSRTFPAD